MIFTNLKRCCNKIVVALIVSILIISANLAFAQNEYGGYPDYGPLTITAPCDDATICQPVCGNSVTVVVVDGDPNAGAVFMTLNGGACVQIGTGPGTNTYTISGLTQGNNMIESYDTNGNWDDITVPSNGNSVSIVETAGPHIDDGTICGIQINEQVHCLPVPGSFYYKESEDNHLADGSPYPGDNNRPLSPDYTVNSSGSLTPDWADSSYLGEPCTYNSAFFSILHPSGITWTIVQSIVFKQYDDATDALLNTYSFIDCSTRVVTVNKTYVGGLANMTTATTCTGPAVDGTIFGQCGPTRCE